MPKSRIILALGCLIALLPILGFPHAWESFFQIFAGFGIVLLSVMIAVDKRLTQRAKAEKRLARRHTPVQPDNSSEMRAAQTAARFGRRMTDQIIAPPASTPPPTHPKESQNT
jgi:hypothetical protein